MLRKPMIWKRRAKILLLATLRNVTTPILSFTNCILLTLQLNFTHWTEIVTATFLLVWRKWKAIYANRSPVLWPVNLCATAKVKISNKLSLKVIWPALNKVLLSRFKFTSSCSSSSSPVVKSLPDDSLSDTMILALHLESSDPVHYLLHLNRPGFGRRIQ